LVIAALKKVEEERLCRLHGYVVMPNHVHVLLTAIAALERLTFLIKGRTARQANLLLDRTGRRFWQNESFDHWIRNSAEFERVQHYIETNPVKAGLAASPSAWPWSSAQ
jgi:putative transposase